MSWKEYADFYGIEGDPPPRVTGVPVPMPEVNLEAAAARLRRHRWRQVTRGRDGLGGWEHRARGLQLIHSIALELDRNFWEHVSVSLIGHVEDQMPSWEQVRDTFRDVSGPDALGIIVIPPKAEHVDIGEVAHVWRCLTARPIPDFTRGGRSI